MFPSPRVGRLTESQSAVSAPDEIVQARPITNGLLLSDYRVRRFGILPARAACEGGGTLSARHEQKESIDTLKALCEQAGLGTIVVRHKTQRRKPVECITVTECGTSEGRKRASLPYTNADVGSCASKRQKVWWMVSMFALINIATTITREGTIYERLFAYGRRCLIDLN